MLKEDITILNTSTTASSEWKDVSIFEEWALFVDALETTAKIDIYIAYGNSQPASNFIGFKAATISTVGGVAGNGTIVDSSGNPVVAHWIRVNKVQGGTPAVSKVNFFGRSFDI